ncbi:hypothetical protein Cni_G13876 [Canna indica]|uniref:Agenet domain-containing protein n=1 Tax=Canna indica TaxID=4628 RepID=A0AAQ3KCW6_9LILI|nr:hypothetical protein Cni_G13876 [Canna indica]
MSGLFATLLVGERNIRKKTQNIRRKLLLGENVEVLFCDEGLRGSWHTGTVIDCRGCSRLIEYRDLLSEDECSKLKELVPVSAIIEGKTRRLQKNFRGRIRPLPPFCDIDISKIRYGLCVDALVDDAWWEGVVIDHEEGSRHRLILFPDLGDQHMVSIDQLRLTQEWNEVSESWTPRGDWLLLLALQPFEDVMPVSLTEFWYHLSTMASFREKIGLWMLGSQPAWDNLVTGLIQELLSVVHDLSEISDDQSVDGNDEIPMDIETKGKNRSQDIKNQKSSFPCKSINHQESHNLRGLELLNYSAQGSNKKRKSHSATKGTKSKSHRAFSPQKLADDSDHRDTSIKKVHPTDFCEDEQRSNSSMSGKENLESNTSESIEPEYYPEAIISYKRHVKSTRENGNQKIPKSDIELMRLNAKKHLLYMGWRFVGMARLRYASPVGEVYHSLYTACEAYLDKKVRDYLENSNVSQNF